MKQIAARILPLSLAFLLLAGCGGTAPVGDRAEFDAFLAGMNGRQSAAMTWTEEERAVLNGWEEAFSNMEDPFTEAERIQLVTPREETRRVTREEAREDVETLFRAIRAAYGGYEYFGGDAVFGPLEAELLSLLDKGSYSAFRLEEVLRQELGNVVRDGHFIIGDRSMIGGYWQEMYYVPDLYFDDPAGLDMDYVKPTIGPNGALTYCFAALSQKRTGLPKTAVLDGREVELDWKQADRFQIDSQAYVGYRRTEKRGVAVLESRTMMVGENSASQQEMDEFAAAGEEYRGLPVLIVDVRGNSGGNNYHANMWLNGFAGTEVEPKEASGSKYSPLLLTCAEVNDDYAPVRDFLYEWAEESAGTGPFSIRDGVFAPNETLVLALMDKKTSSAGEGFLRNLRAVENVIFVGSNTHGNIMFGNAMQLWLPHSGLHIQMGGKLSFLDGLENTEGVGIPPDLWVDPPDAMDAVLRLIRYYGLA